MNELVKVDPKEFGLDELQVVSIEQAFLPKIAERDGYAQIYEQLITKEITKELCAEAWELRKKLVKTRTGIADIHRTQKSFFLAAGKFVDAWKNKETAPVEQMEETLSEIEKYFEKIEAEKVEKLYFERKSELSLYSEIFPSGLGVMDETVYQNYMVGVKLGYEAKIKAEQDAEAERLRLIEVDKENARLKTIEQERIRKENEKLKVEAAAREKEIETERKRQSDLLAKQKADSEAKQKAIEDTARIEREKAETERKRLENELRVSQEIERKAKELGDKIEAERIESIKRAAKAPDKEKLQKMVDSIQITIPELKDNAAIATANVINAKFEAFKAWAKSQIQSV